MGLCNFNSEIGGEKCSKYTSHTFDYVSYAQLFQQMQAELKKGFWPL